MDNKFFSLFSVVTRKEVQYTYAQTKASCWWGAPRFDCFLKPYVHLPTCYVSFCLFLCAHKSSQRIPNSCWWLLPQILKEDISLHRLSHYAHEWCDLTLFKRKQPTSPACCWFMYMSVFVQQTWTRLHSPTDTLILNKRSFPTGGGRGTTGLRPLSGQIHTEK